MGLDPEGPAMLAGINRVETDFGQDLGTSSAGAIGWMQFEPETWEEYGRGGDPNNPHDAIFAAARLLKANGAPGDWYKAIFTYNHADWYVEEVEKYAHEYATEVPADPSADGKEAPETESETDEASPPESGSETAEAPETESETDEASTPESESETREAPETETESVEAPGTETRKPPRPIRNRKPLTAAAKARERSRPSPAKMRKFSPTASPPPLPARRCRSRR